MGKLTGKVPGWLKVVIKALLAILLIYWVIQRGSLDFSVLREIFSAQLLIPGLLLTFGNLYLVSERWRRLLYARDIDLGSWQALRLTLIGNFFNFAMPGAVGGDVIKGYYISRNYPEQKMLTAISVLVDRLVGFYAMVIMALAVMLIQIQWILDNEKLLWLFVGTLAFFLAFSFFFLFAFSKRNRFVLRCLRLIHKLPGGGLVEKVYRSVHVYGDSPGTFFVGLILSFASQLVSVGFFWWVGQMMGLSELSIWSYIMAIPLGFIVSALPLAPAGIGVGQAAFLFFFNLITGIETQLGPTAITLFQMTLFVYGIWGSILYMRQKDRFQEVMQNG